MNDEEATAFAVARARVALARGDAVGSAAALDAVKTNAREWKIARARTYTRQGNYAASAKLAGEAAVQEKAEDAVAADALSVHGVALAYVGDEARATNALERAVALARKVEDARIEAVALSSLAIAHQRGGRTEEARTAYEAALVSAEKARDAWTLATTRLNLAGIAKHDGDLAQALVHLEAALDMGRRAGALMAVQQTLFNLANVDLYLGRFARAGASIENLTGQKERLSPSARAQLLGLQAELATRMGDAEKGARLYDLCADAYDAVGRPLDAAEARLEGILARLGATMNDPGSPVDAASLGRDLDLLTARLEGGFQEHEALAGIVRGSLALARGDEAVRTRGARLRPRGRPSPPGSVSGPGARSTRARGSPARKGASRSLGATPRLRSRCSKRPQPSSRAICARCIGTTRAAARSAKRTPPRCRRSPAATRRSPAALNTAGITALGRTASITSMGTPMPAEDRLQRIFEITRELAHERDLGRLLQRVTDHAVGLLGAERGLIVIVNDDGEVVAHTARDSGKGESHANFSRSVAERVIRDNEPIITTSRARRRAAQAGGERSSIDDPVDRMRADPRRAACRKDDWRALSRDAAPARTSL